MKILVFYAFCCFGLILSSYQNSRNDFIVFTGEVVEKGDVVGPSGTVAQYQEVRYKVKTVCQGYYAKDEITTEHLILNPHELEDVIVGSKVCVGANRKNVPNYSFNNEKQEFVLDGERVVYRVNDVFIRNCSCNEK